MAYKILTYETYGDFSAVQDLLERGKEFFNAGILNEYGRKGVEALKAATPRDTGLTAESWYYEIQRGEGLIRLSFNNSNTNQGIPIAILIQYGHATRNGGFVEGIDYINPALRPVFDELAEKLWKEVSK
jgi:hypothetical protein